MTTELSDSYVTVETVTDNEGRDPAPRSGKAPFIFDLVGSLLLMLFFAGLFFALKVCLETCLPFVTHEITEHARAIRGAGF